MANGNELPLKERMKIQRQPMPELDAIRFVTFAPQEDIGAGVDHDMHPGGIGSRPQRAHQFCVFAGRPQSLTLGVHGVLDIEPDGAHAQQALDQPGRRQPVSRFDVNGHRDVDRGGDLRDPGQHVLERHALTVRLADRIGQRMTTHGECDKSGASGQARRPGVPHRRQDYRVARLMQLQQCRGPIGRGGLT